MLKKGLLGKHFITRNNVTIINACSNPDSARIFFANGKLSLILTSTTLPCLDKDILLTLAHWLYRRCFNTVKITYIIQYKVIDMEIIASKYLWNSLPTAIVEARGDE